jgi:uroporphyrin-III C-methyltransferase
MIPMSDEARQGDPPPPSRVRLTGAALLAVALALLALAVAVFGYWNSRRLAREEAHRRAPIASRLVALERQVDARNRQGEAGEHRVAVLESTIDGLRTDLRDLDQRTANLETAFAALSGRQASAHDALLLDDAAMLLRTGEQRFDLFRDADGALKAYALAVQVLGQVHDPAYAPVRAAAASERDALEAAAPPSRQAALDTLSALRSRIGALPLASPEVGKAPSENAGLWSRVAHAFSGIVHVQRDTGAAAPVVDAQFARELAALDLAQAQEALLAFDEDTYQQALRRVAATLAARFDGDDPSVQSARAQVAALRAQHPGGAPPRLGGALAQLRNLRASAALHPGAPATASSGGASQP